MTTLDILIATLTARMERYAESPATVADLQQLALCVREVAGAVEDNARMCHHMRTTPPVPQSLVDALSADADGMEPYDERLSELCTMTTTVTQLRAAIAQLTAERDALVQSQQPLMIKAINAHNERDAAVDDLANVRAVVVAEIAAWLDERARTLDADNFIQRSNLTQHRTALQNAAAELRAGTRKEQG